jgi:pimeloyl-ACP methyl ester carboxylesterase
VERHPGLRRKILITLGIIFFVFLLLPYVIPQAKREPSIGYQQMLSPASRFLSIDSSSIHIEDYMPAGAVKENLILVHGFGGSTYSWRNNITSFVSAGYRVVAVDLKGFGLSSKDMKSSYSHAAQADILAGVAGNLGIDKAVFVAHSMGASVILHLAGVSPHLVKGMVLVDGAASYKRQLPVSRLLGFGPIKRAFQDIINYYLSEPRLTNTLKSAYYQPHNLSDRDIANYYSRVVYGDWLDGLTAMTRDGNENTIDFTLGKNIPTLVVWGSKDTWVGRDVAEKISSFTGGDLRVIENAGHLSMEEAPDIFNPMVLEFLSQNWNTWQ